MSKSLDRLRAEIDEWVQRGETLPRLVQRMEAVVIAAEGRSRQEGISIGRLQSSADEERIVKLRLLSSVADRVENRCSGGVERVLALVEELRREADRERKRGRLHEEGIAQLQDGG